MLAKPDRENLVGSFAFSHHNVERPEGSMALGCCYKALLILSSLFSNPCPIILNVVSMCNNLQAGKVHHNQRKTEVDISDDSTMTLDANTAAIVGNYSDRSACVVILRLTIHLYKKNPEVKTLADASETTTQTSLAL